MHLRDRCPDCGCPFEREEGYWVGAMIMNTGATQLVFFACFLGGLFLLWPVPPWSEHRGFDEPRPGAGG